MSARGLRLELIRLVPGTGFSMTEPALNKVGRRDVLYDLHSPEEVHASSKPLQVIPAGGTWNFLPDGQNPGALRMLEDALPALEGFGHVSIVFDCAGEGFYFYPDQHRRISEALNALRIDPESTYFLTSRLDPDQAYRRWCEENDQRPLFRAIYSPVQLYYYAGIYRAHANLPWLDIMITSRSPSVGRSRGKKYVCLNFMPREARWATVLSLLDAGLLSDGHVSFHGRAAAETSGEATPEVETIRASLRELRLPEPLIARLEELEALAPITLDNGAPSRFEKAYGLADQPYWADAYFAIVTESDFPGHAGERFTEKVLKPLANLLPFVIVGTPGTLRELRRLGFMTFDGLIDESYDEIEDPGERLAAVLEVILSLAGKSHAELQDFYAAAWPRLTHNLLHFISMAPALVDQDPAFLELSAT